MEEAIFPIVTFNPDKKEWICLGTGYFINPFGAFMTAKHLFIDETGKMEKTLYSVHKGNGIEYIRPVKSLTAHQNADIIVGMLGEKRIGLQSFKPPLANYCSLDLNPLAVGDKIYTYAYPNTLWEDLNESETEFTFTCAYSEGEIIDFHESTSKVKNRCFQTNMKIDSGASGGPVFKGNYIVGINSSSFDLGKEEEHEPISFITPVEYILDMNVKENGKLVKIKNLILDGHIKTKK